MRYFNETFKTDSRFILQTLVNLTLKISLRIFLKILRTTWSKETNRSLKHMKTVRRQQEKKIKTKSKRQKRSSPYTSRISGSIQKTGVQEQTIRHARKN